MGEIADMMLDGTLCEGCGAFIDDEGGDGIPRYCSNQCARDRGALHALPNPAITTRNPANTNCPTCRKRVKVAGLSDHMRDAHPQKETTMSAIRQFCACKFRVTDTRSFTYHWDGAEPLADGDTVRVPDRSGDGWKKVYVADANAPEPTAFATKAILGRHVDDEPTDLETAARDAA